MRSSVGRVIIFIDEEVEVVIFILAIVSVQCDVVRSELRCLSFGRGLFHLSSIAAACTIAPLSLSTFKLNNMFNSKSANCVYICRP